MLSKNDPLHTFPALQEFITSFTTPTINLHRQRPLEKTDQTKKKNIWNRNKYTKRKFGKLNAGKMIYRVIYEKKTVTHGRWQLKFISLGIPLCNFTFSPYRRCLFSNETVKSVFVAFIEGQRAINFRIKKMKAIVKMIQIIFRVMFASSSCCFIQSGNAKCNDFY